MATYGYLRVSSAKQAALGESLETQEKMLLDYARQQGLADVSLLVDDGQSAFKKRTQQRPKWQELESVLKPGDAVIATRLDRCFRSVLDAKSTVESFRKRKISLHLIDLAQFSGSKSGDIMLGNGMSSFFFTIIAAFAELESYRTGERIREVKARLKSEARFLGGRVERGFTVRRIDSKSYAVANPFEKLVLEDVVRYKKLRDDEIRSKGRADRYTLEAIWGHLNAKYSRKGKSLERKRTTASGKPVRSFGLMTLHRLMNPQNPNNAEVRLERIKALEKRFVSDNDGRVTKARQPSIRGQRRLGLRAK